MSICTTCPLDCFDSCSIEVQEDGMLKGEKAHPITQGFLCHHLNHYHKFERIHEPMLDGKAVSMDEALQVLEKKLHDTDPQKTLYFKGSGNLGVMQSITKNFFAKHGAHVAKGSLCEDAGTAGIEEGRGASLVWSPSEVAKSDVVVLWGRNASITSSHVLPALKGKTIIVIDPVRIDLAQKADLHVQIRPRSDLYFAMLLARIAYMEQMEDEEFIQERTDNFDYYIDMVNGIPMKRLLHRSGVGFDAVGEFLSLIKGKNVSFLVGLGVQKYTFGHSVLRAIDSFVAMMGLFGKEGCGVSYIADSSYGFASPFKTKATTVDMPIVDFGKYDLVFIQGGNPLGQMPCTPKVKEGIEKAGFVVYFGLHENASSKAANLIIPAKSFLEKDDLRLSYGHEYIGAMPKIHEVDFGISEYDLCSTLLQRFDYERLQSEQSYIDNIAASNSIKHENGRLIAKTLQKTPYSEEFYTDSGLFEFFDEYYDDIDDENVDEGYFLLSSKHKTSLNSQFKVDTFLHVPPSLGYEDGATIQLSNGEYTHKYKVKNDERLRDDCFLLNSGHPYANMLTPRIMSEEGKCAVFQEVKVFIVDAK